MAETEENGEWSGLITTSPKDSGSNHHLFSGFLAEGGRGFGPNDEFSVLVKKEEDGLDVKMKENSKPRNVGGGGGGGGGSIAERRAARCGFNAVRINTARFRTISPLSSPSVRSPYLTIPPGLSPTSLLDSPVMLPNSQAQPSPTTGTLQLPLFGFESPMPISAIAYTDKDEDSNSSFVFKPHLDAVSFHCASGTENQDSAPSSHNLGVEMLDVNLQIPVQAHIGYEQDLLRQAMTKNCAAASSSEIEVSHNLILNTKAIALHSSDTCVGNEHQPQLQEQGLVEETGLQQISEGDQRGAYPLTITGRPSEDGYNWRKYGQKQVKGSEYPRSYYKCTHPNCQVKKKIERSHDGQITEIIYKGAHNHPQPQPSRRSTLGSAFPPSEMSEMGEDAGSYVKVEGGSAWKSTPQGSKDNRSCSEWRADGMERTSSTSVVTELSDPLSTAQGKQLGILESADTLELSSTLASHDEEDDRATQGSISLGDDGDDDESESKRRKKDNCLIETNLASRAVREPRVVVQTDSEVDILDDGYRWRKYGQKVVKGNPNPRSYYKCTNAGCSVRKHVERASHDLKYVITTYEGKHNHEVPAARSSSHMNSTGGNVPSVNSNAQTTLTLPRSNNMSKPEPHVQDFVPRFERKPEFSNEFFKPGNLGGFASDMKFLPSSCYDLKLPPYQTAMPYGSFGLNSGHNEAARQTASVIGQVVPDFALPMSVPLSGNLALPNFDFNNNHGKAVAPLAQSYLRGQQPKDADMRFVRPKQEQNDDAVYETQLPINHLAANASSSSSIYRQIMGGGFQL